MLPMLTSALGGFGLLKTGVPLGLKTLKYFVDSVFRDKVCPVPGSVVYCDLWLAVEHSGIYVGDGQISNIEVDGIAESVVRLCDPESFTSKSILGRKIYVSCDSGGAVGHTAVAKEAKERLGERAFYGIVINNCHQFSTRCVNRAGTVHKQLSPQDQAAKLLPSGTVEPTMAALKRAARARLGATKWRLWDYQNDDRDEAPAEPDWDAHSAHFENLPLDEHSIATIRNELAAALDYEQEIADENIPPHIRQHLATFRKTLTDIAQKYEEVKGFLAACPEAHFSYADLKNSGEDFAALAAQMQRNANIKELGRKLGRDYVSEERKQKSRVPQASQSEVYGTDRSGDVMRMLPCELLNLEDETLETLFYARLLEKNLLSYELRGTVFIEGEQTTQEHKQTGPVVACLDTSGSMQGKPLLKAKALLLAIANILKAEGRSLHVLLFGASGEIREFAMTGSHESAGLLAFLQTGYGGGTDFESPLRRSLEIIGQHEAYKKADILMISDGDCTISPEFSDTLRAQKSVLDCSIYSVLCAGSRVADTFSDEVIVL